MREIILTCAVTGNLTTPEQTPHLPITPEQIATSALEAAAAGAAVVHLHVRHPEDGRPSMDFDHYAQVVTLIRDADPRLIINLTTGPGGRFVPSAHDPRVAGPGTTLLPPGERVSHIERLRPEVSTLDLNTMNSGDQVVMNTPSSVRAMAQAIGDAGVTPEIELFNAGDAVLAVDLLKGRPFRNQPYYSFVLGTRYGWPASIESIQLGKSLIPSDATWAAFGIGRHAFGTLALSVLMGGHARIGIEDTVYLAKGRLAKTNAELCTKARRIIEDLGFSVASPATARSMILKSINEGDVA